MPSYRYRYQFGTILQVLAVPGHDTEHVINTLRHCYRLVSIEEYGCNRLITFERR